MSAADEQPCLSGPEILQEQFIPDHVFLYVTKGIINCYDGHKSYTLKSGEYGLARKNRLARYNNEKGTGFERIIFCFEEEFIRSFQEKRKLTVTKFNSTDTFVKITPTEMIPDFIRSLKPYIDSSGKINEAFEEVKYEELLIILLQNQPELAGIFFDYATPQKINLEEFMSRNYKFNVRIERFAYLTGRGLSAFKRDFKAIFNQAPNHWLIQRRLQEAYILIEKEHKKASEIYLDLGFEDLSHFSLAFKNLFGLRPTELSEQITNNTKTSP
jgi:AraC family transcriptional regulator, exoenzyme S synthesis regulatory protein ExsA